jgi:hypothetical protein
MGIAVPVDKAREGIGNFARRLIDATSYCYTECLAGREGSVDTEIVEFKECVCVCVCVYVRPGRIATL